MLSGRVAFLALTLLSVSAHAEDGGTSMPQLDPTYYLSQLFWLALCGVALYVVMARVALPRVAAMIDQRDEQVRHDLELAHKLKQQAEDIKVSYTRAVREAEDKAKARLDALAKTMKTQQDAALHETVERLQHQIKETENYLRGEKDVLLRDLKVYADNVSKIIIKELNAKRAA
jgi:F-type H+-transporting ATPase subunit b